MGDELGDRVVGRVVGNTTRMGVGKAVGAVLHLISIAVTARVLGPTNFGALILLRSLAQAVAAVAKFQSWQALIHFGAESYQRGDRAAVGQVWVRLAAIDAVTGVVAMAVGASMVTAGAGWAGVPDGFSGLAALYCLVIPLQVAGTPIGVLRLTNRFTLLAWQSLITPAVRICGVTAAYLAGAPLWGVVGAWVLSDIAGDVFLWLCAIPVARREGIAGGGSKKDSASPLPLQTAWRYLVGTNLNATLQQGGPPLLTLAIGSTMGAATAGAFRVAQTLVEAIGAPVELIARSLFPEISKLLVEDARRLVEVLGRFVMIGLSVSLPAGLLLYALSDPLVRMLAGTGYADAQTLLQALAWTLPSLFIASICETFMLGTGRAFSPVLSRLVGVAVSVASVAYAGDRLGVEGLGQILLAASYLTLVLIAVPTARSLRGLMLSGESV